MFFHRGRCHCFPKSSRWPLRSRWCSCFLWSDQGWPFRVVIITLLETRLLVKWTLPQKTTTLPRLKHLTWSRIALTRILGLRLRRLSKLPPMLFLLLSGVDVKMFSGTILFALYICYNMNQRPQTLIKLLKYFSIIETNFVSYVLCLQN